MIILFSAIITFSIIIGSVWGWAVYGFGVELIACVGVAGFLGTCIVAALFTYFYFFHQETDKEKIERLKLEIKQSKEKKNNK